MFPTINRARGYFLYTSDGKRYLDMSLDDGALLMGHRQDGFAQALKNAADKGLFVPYPSPFEYRFKQALKSLFGEGRYIYLVQKMNKLLLELPEWRPFEDFRSLDAFVPVLPIPSAFAPCVVVSDKELEVEEVAVSPVILAGAVKVVYNLEKFLETADYSMWQDASVMSVLENFWKVRIPYLYPAVDKGSYCDLLKVCLANGIVLSPDYDKPSVVPANISNGMLNKVLRCFE